MSVCLIIQKQNEIYIGTDTAICSLIDNKYVRTGEYEEKFFVKDNIGYYCSGKLEITDKIKEYINNNSNIEQIINYIKLLDSQYSFDDLDVELIIVSLNKCIHISKYNNFNPIRYEIKNIDDMYLLSIGFKASENYHKLYNNLINDNQSEINSIKNAIINSTCQEIGGKCKIYHLNKNEFDLVVNERIDDITFQNTKNNNFLVNGEVLMGELIAGNQLVIKNSNNSFVLDSQGAVLKNATFTVEKGLNKILLDPTNGFKIQKKVNNVFTDMVYTDTDGNAVYKGNITGANIEGSSLTGGSINIGNEMFMVDSTGKISIKRGNFNIANIFTVDDDGTVNIKKGSLNINSNFIVDQLGNVNMNGTLNVANKLTVDGYGNMTIYGGSISWASSDPKIEIAQGSANTALSYAQTAQSSAQDAYGVATTARGNITKLSNGTFTGGTFIDGETIRAPFIEGGEIDGIDIYGSYFHGSNVNSAFIKIGIGNGSNLGDLSLYRGGASTPMFQIYDNLTRIDLIAQNGSFLATTGANTYAYGVWNFSNATITGIDTVAKFA